MVSWCSMFSVIAVLLPNVCDCARISKEKLHITASCASGEFFFRLGGELMGFTVEQSTSEAGDISVACPSTARNPSGKAKFRCHSSAQWMLVSEECSYSQGAECGAGNFQVALGGHRAVYSLSPTAVGTDAKLACKFGPFTKGEIVFRCSSSGAWQMGGNDCQLGSREDVIEPLTCRPGNFPLALGGARATYVMPSGVAHQRVDQDCAFGDINQGQISFQCSESGRWSIVGNNCRRAGECVETEYSILMHKINQTFALHRASSGTTVSRPCAFGDATVGQVLFRCAGGQWMDMPESMCMKPGQCSSQVVEHSLGWIHTEVGEAGETVAQQCDFGALSEGNVNLQCMDGSWRVTSHDCHEPPLPEGMICKARDASFTRSILGMWSTVQEQQEVVTFHLPLAGIGVSRLPCVVQGFTGYVSFNCHDNGQWTLLQTPGSNSCHKSSEWEESYATGGSA